MQPTAYEDVNAWRPPDAKFNVKSPSTALGVPLERVVVVDARKVQEWDGDWGRFLLLLRVASPANSGTRSNTTGGLWFHTADMPIFEAMKLVNKAIEQGLVKNHMPRYTSGATESAEAMRAAVNAPYSPLCSTARGEDEKPSKRTKKREKEKREKKEKKEKKAKYLPAVATRDEEPPGSELTEPPKKHDRVLARDADRDWYHAKVFNLFSVGTMVFASVHFVGWPKEQDITWTVGDGNIRLPSVSSLPVPEAKVATSVEDDVEDAVEDDVEDAVNESEPEPEPKKYKLVYRKNPDAARDMNLSSSESVWTVDNDTDDESVYGRIIARRRP